jgi:hypothetical protein
MKQFSFCKPLKNVGKSTTIFSLEIIISEYFCAFLQNCPFRLIILDLWHKTDHLGQIGQHAITVVSHFLSFIILQGFFIDYF